MTPDPFFILFWGSVLLILYAYFGYPMVLAALGLVRRRSVTRRPITPRVSFVITAHNEARSIAAKIENTLEQTYPADALEIIVASDCSTDGTDAIAAGFAPRVKVVRPQARKGKEAAQQLAVMAASGEVLVFSDVGTRLAADGVATLVENFADPTVGCVSSIDRCVDDRGRISGEGAYVRYEMALRVLETRVHSLVGLSGSCFAARREICADWASDRQSDFNTLLNAIALGYRGVLDTRAVGYYRNITDERREFQRKVRTVVRSLHVLFSRPAMLNPVRYGLFAWQLASHKLCRWLVPFAMITAALSSGLLAAGSPFYLAAVAAQGAFYGAALLGMSSRRTLMRLPAYLCVANLGILAAWFRFASGDRMTMWTPSQRTASLSGAESR
jgi:glycosyltransferase involved in cell wall biosynthesis